MVCEMTGALPLRIFLASPGDLDLERSAVKTCVDEYNAKRTPDSKLTYEILGWDRIRGTARRPQEAINELIPESQFLVVLFGESWGSEPGSPWGYTSGTEEELFTGLLDLGDPERPMRDVWVAFIKRPSPAPQITKLRDQMSDRHSLMYEVINSEDELKTKFKERLIGWEALAEFKVTRNVELLPSSDNDVLRAAKLRRRGEKLFELGQGDAGLTALEEAVNVGGPDEKLALARFLARRGNFADAYSATERAIIYFTDDKLPLYSAQAAEAFAAQAGILRRQGQQIEAIDRLSQALTLLESPDAYGQKVRCRILDERGLAHQKADDLPSARRDLEESLAIRRSTKRDLDVCQSLINLARLEVKSGQLNTAAMYADEIVTTLKGFAPTSLHANAEALVAQVRIRQGRGAEGLPHASRSLTLNQQIANKLGEAISLRLLAQCYREDGQLEEARLYATKSLDMNNSIGDHRGAAQAQWILDDLKS